MAHVARQMERHIPVTVIVLTHNEEQNITACLNSVSNFTEVIVVDSGSTDGTLGMVAKGFEHVRVLHHPFRDFGDQRNWALEHGNPTNDWVLFLDADERCTKECAAAIGAAVFEPAGHVGFFLCYRNMFLDRWIKHCTMFPSWQLRLLKIGYVRFRKEGHGQREELAGPAGYIQAPYDHYGFSKGVHHWVSRHNEYSTNEIELIRTLATERVRWSGLMSLDPVVRRRTLKQVAARVALRPLVRFLYQYIGRGGFLDGRPGFLYCLLRLAHEIHIIVKLEEVHRLGAVVGHGRPAAGAPRRDAAASPGRHRESATNITALR